MLSVFRVIKNTLDVIVKYWYHVNLPWTNILPTGIVGEVLHAAKTALSWTRLSLGAYA